jgi:hypothetical protein
MLSMAADGGVIERAMKMIKVILPLPDEDLPNSPKSAEQVKEDEVEEDIETEDEDIPTEEEPPQETESEAY